MAEKIISLNGNWRYKTDEKAAFGRTMRIPGNWETAGLHDYSGAVWFEKKFQVARGKGQEYILRFKGVDYFADVWLNGKYLGKHEGYFQPFEFNVTKLILDGENTLIVKVNSPKEDLKNWPHEKRYIKGVFGHHDVRPGSWSAKYGQMMGTGGIWNDVQLIETDRIRVKDVKIVSGLGGVVRVAAEVENKFSSVVVSSVVVRVRGDRKSKVVSRKWKVEKLRPGTNQVKLELKIQKPKLWWTWDQGEQNLYVAEVRVRVKGMEAGREVRFGLREIGKDKDGNWMLNGRRIFVRGANIIPEEYLSTYTQDRIAKDIELIKEANVNAVRVHAHVNREELYDACDEAGIMVWQDFALQWEYGAGEAFIREAVHQIKDMVKLHYNHPSIVLWACHNESIRGKKKLDNLLYKAVSDLDRTRLIIKASEFGEHPYPGWFWGKMEYFQSLPGGALPSEFGAMALPNLRTLRKMFKPKDLWPPNWIEWAKRDFTYDQMFHVAKVPIGGSIKKFITNSQDYQAKLIKFAVELYRMKKFIGVAGLFHFLFLEPWPCISYSVLDYYRRPKEGFYALKTAYQPILAIAALNRDTYGIGRAIEAEFHVLNDHEKAFRGLNIIISMYEGSKRVHRFKPIRFTLKENCCKYLTPVVYSSTDGLKIPERLKPGIYRLVFDVLTGAGLKLSTNSYDISLKRIPKGLEEFNAHFVWD